VADVPVGVMLSGGLDSSAVAAAAIRPDGPPLNTFSVSFDESPATDERPYARRVAAHLGTLHHEVVIGQQDFTGLLPEFVRMTDEPLADLASIPLYCVSKLAREHVKVVLSGEGSDEILGGYEFELLVQAWGRKSRVRRLWERLRRRDEEPMLNMTNYLSSEEKERLFGGGVRFPDSMEPLRADLRHLGSRDRLHQVLYTFCQSWLVEDLLMKADKMSMANSLELRTPFLDYRLVEWAARCPSWIKVGPNGNGELVTKRILRRFARSRLPAEILARPKQGFPVPVYDWLSGSLQSWAADLLTGPEGRLQHLFDPRAVRRSLALGSAPAGGLLDRHRLWNLLILELWMRAWKPQIDASWPSHG
jgi:asparagine synthase (glutamine-hydrolysing)